MANKTGNKRKILQVFCILIIFLGLLISIGFSTFNISTKTLFNSRYSGGYQALVEVYDSNATSGSSQIANGDASAAAASLEQKLSPFSDNTVDIKVVGKHRVSVTSTKEQYNSSLTAFKNAIEQDGGLLALTSEYKDILFDDTTMTKVTGSNVFTDGKITQKIAISDIFGEVKYLLGDSSTGSSYAPYLTFSSSPQHNDYLEKLVSSSTDESTGESTNQTLTLVSSMQTVINNLREYYTLAPSSDPDAIDEYLLAYYKGVIVPLQTIYAQSDGITKAVLDDLFSINYQVKHNNIVSESQTSLIGSNLDFWWMDNNKNHAIQGTDVEVVRQLKAIIYGKYEDPITPQQIDDYEFSFINSANKYVVDANSTTDDFNDAQGKYANSFEFSLNNSNAELKINDVADIINKTLLNDVLFADIDNNAEEYSPFNRNLKQEVFQNNFILINGQINYSASSEATSQNTRAGTSNAEFINKELRIGMPSATIAKSIQASISQTTSGFNFKVIQINEFNPDITIIMLIASLTFLLILVVIAMAYLVYFYRLMGVYTLIIAVTSVFLTLVIPTFFGIAIGVETITLIFIVLAVIIDSCVIFMESFKKHLNREKRSQIESFKLSNKDNASIIFDLIFLITVPNIILFWFSSGSLKNLATIAVVSIFATLILVLVVFRLLLWLSVKGNIFKKNPLLLPLDTSILNNRSAIRLKLKLAKINYKLSKFTLIDKLSSNDLIKIKKLNDLEIELNNEINKKEEIFKKKNIEKHQLKISKIDMKIEKRSNISESNNIFKKLNNWFKKDQVKTLSISKEFSNAIVNQHDTDSVRKASEKKQARISLNVNRLLLIVTLILSTVGLIIGLTVGPSYSNDFGRDKTFIVYGSDIANFENNNYEDVIEVINESNSKKASELENIHQEIVDKYENQPEFNYSAELVAATLQFLYKTDLINLFSEKEIKGTNSAQVTYGYDYKIEGTNDVTEWVQVTLPNKTSLGRNRTALKRVIVNTSSYWSGSETEISSDHGILGLEQTPFTAIGQVKQILISFGVLLAALIVYIIIRFKWTYYVALALGIIVVGAITTSLVIVFRVPISYELLSTFVAVISFAILSIILILGKIRSYINEKTKDQLIEEFNSEINIKSELHKNIFARKAELLAIKNANNKQIQELKHQKINLKIKKKSKIYLWNVVKSLFINNKSDEVKDVVESIKIIKKQRWVQVRIVKKSIKRIKKESKLIFNSVIKHNKFMSYVLNETINYAIKKIFVIGLFYLVFALILVFTLPTIIGVGLTMLIGIFVTYLFILSAAIPLTTLLEKRRIAKRYAYKDFIKIASVTNEEQIVKDIND